MKNRPNFFIVGAPKCGTTSICKYLKTHSNIFITEPKEPHFFSTDMRPYGCCTSIKEYFKLYDSHLEDEIILGEGSVMYLYSDDAIENIYKFNSNAKILIMLRNTIEYLHSYHNQMLLNCDEDIDDFESAWRMQYERRNDRNIPKTCRIKKLLDYEKVGKLGEQVEKVFRIFPKEQIHIVLLEDMKNNPKQIYSDILDFLNLKNDEKNDFPIINENTKAQFKFLNKLRNHPPKNLYKMILLLKKLFHVENKSFTKKIFELNLRKQKKKVISNEFKKELIVFFEKDIYKLEKLINRDLKHWKEI